MNGLSKNSKEHTHEPLHQLLFELSKGWLQWPSRVVRPQVNSTAHENEPLAQRVIVTTVQQLCTSLRMQNDIAGEDETMLASVEVLVLAGEITFTDFMGRVQNLFPRAMDGLDMPLRMRINALMLDGQA